MNTRAGEVLNSVYDGETNSLRVKNIGSDVNPPDPTARAVHAAYQGPGRFGQMLIQNGGKIRSARIVKE